MNNPNISHLASNVIVSNNIARHHWGVHKTLHANACWRSYCQFSSHKRELLCHIIPFLYYSIAYYRFRARIDSAPRLASRNVPSLLTDIMYICILWVYRAWYPCKSYLRSHRRNGEKLGKTFQTHVFATNEGERKKYSHTWLVFYVSMSVCMYVNVLLYVYMYLCVNMRVDLDVVLINSLPVVSPENLRTQL